jgi:uncharacterized membrane protein
MSSGGIVLASLAAYWMGEFSNSFVLAKMKILTSGRWLWTRTIGSTLVGELVDSVVFIAVASLFGVFPWSLFITLAFTNYLFKSIFEQALEDQYQQLKIHLGKALLLGLEILVAADIIRTVALEATLQSVAVLGLLVLIRTFLSWALVVEIEGRWPWQRPYQEENTN